MSIKISYEMEYKPLGTRLVEAGCITADQLDLALKRQQHTGELLGAILCKLGFIAEDAVLSRLADEAGARHIELNSAPVQREALALIPEAFARSYKVFPMYLSNNTLTAAMANTFDVVTLDKLRTVTGYDIEAVSATEGDIARAIDRYYGDRISVEGLIEQSIKKTKDLDQDSSGADLFEAAPIVKLVDRIVLNALHDDATDIHLEAEEAVFRVRYRVDGLLRQGPTLPRTIQPAVTSRIKILAGMNISEKRIPQDGRYSFYTGNKRIDIRASTLPTVYGESVVLRLLDRDKLVRGLENLGFSSKTLARYKDIIQKPYGICLVTGPTGSGKTTTLYSTLAYINSLEKNIITLEDPVEYELQTINQCQINAKAGVTFATGLRGILRQDPDIIFVGEIRDSETVAMATQAALTGHLVFSTLHTNDAVSAIARLQEMGVKPFVLSSSLVGIIAQRLVRVICSQCKEKIPAPMDLLRKTGLNKNFNIGQIYKGKGCKTCYHTGYKGRIGIFEILSVTPAIAQLITEGASAQEIRREARRQGMATILEDGLRKVVRGITTLDEITRLRQG